MEAPELIDYCRQFVDPNATLTPDATLIRYVEVFDSHLPDLNNDHQINIFTFHTSVPESASKISLPDVAVDHGAIDYDVICEEMVRSALAFQPDAHVFFVTDADTMPRLEHPRVSVVRLPLQREFPMYERVQAMWAYAHSSLYQKPTVFLDSDAFINKDISWVFHEGMDIAVTYRGGGLMPINEGVFFANTRDTAAVARFFDHYLLVYRRLLSDPVVEKIYGDVRRWRGGQLSLNAITCPLGLPTSLDRAFYLGASIDYHPCTDLNFSFEYDAKLLSKAELASKSIIHLKGGRKVLLDHIVELQTQGEPHREIIEIFLKKTAIGDQESGQYTNKMQHQLSSQISVTTTQNRLNKQIIFVGNNTLMGFQFCEFFEFFGHQTTHLYVPRQEKRCRPEEFFGSSPTPKWSIQHSDFDSLRRDLESRLETASAAPTIFCTGEIESAYLCKWKISHRWIADGADLTAYPFEMNDRALQIRKTLQNSPFIEYVFGSQQDMKHACRVLGLANRHIYNFVSPPPLRVIQGAEKKREYYHEQSRLQSNNKRFVGEADFTILTPARRVYSDSSKLFSKGTEHICPALQEVSILHRNFHLIATASGPHSARFKEEIAKLNLAHVTLLPHLSQQSLFNLFCEDRVLVLDQFGVVETAFSGILREAVFFGAPTISNQNLRDIPFDLERSFFRATNSTEIAKNMDEILSLSLSSYYRTRVKILSHVIDNFSPSAIIDMLLMPTTKAV